jgi:hypothetical protein
MTRTGAHGDLIERLERRYDRVEQFVNEDIANLLGALAALVLRYGDSGLTKDERKPDGLAHAVQWAVERGHARATQHMLVSLWAALESYVEDLWIEAATLIAIDSASKLGRVKASIIELRELSDTEQYRRLWEGVETSKVFGIDRYQSVYEMLGIEITIRNIKEFQLTMPTTGSGAPATDEWMLAGLRELRAVRNVIVHAGGVVDRRLAEMQQSRWASGEELDVSNDELVEYGRAVHVYASAALCGVGKRLQLPLVFDEG